MSFDPRFLGPHVVGSLRSSHPIFAAALKRTIGKHFGSTGEFCGCVGLCPAEFERMMGDGPETLRVDTLAVLLIAIHSRSGIACEALIHNFIEDIEERIVEAGWSDE